jgi:endonuclease/exonuclease/phosphatase (EEP) superfamily protein YafD
MVDNANISQHPPTILASININRKLVRILLTHTSRPINNPSYASEIHTLISTIKQQQKPMIVLGDLNTTPWSNYFKELTTSTKLHNTQLGQGISPTYPSHVPKTQIYFPLPVLPLDHVLVNPELHVIRRWNGTYSGSDHLPVFVDLAI